VSSSSPDPLSAELRRKRTVLRHLKHQKFTASLKALVASQPHAFSVSLLSAIRELHPTAPVPARPTVDEAPAQLTADDDKKLMHHIRSFPRGSSGGIDRFCPQLLKDFLHGGVPLIASEFLTALRTFVNIHLAGQVLPEVNRLFNPALLIPLKKPNTEDPRPIAIGLTLRRLISKIAVSYTDTAADTIFRGSQLGVGG
jgi:hypothetical protein